jgi:DNA-binding beta-propeller fold protein YncE
MRSQKHQLKIAGTLGLLLLTAAHPLRSRSAAQGGAGGAVFYVGTLDHKLLVIDEDSEAVVDEIPLAGVPRNTALSADQKQLYIVNTKMGIEVVDLDARKVTSSFSLTDGRSSPMIFGLSPDSLNPGALDFSFSGLAVDPGGRYLYTTVRAAVKEIDQYRLEPAKFIAIDLQRKNIAKAFDFPEGVDRGFGFMATYKVSPDGKLLYVFDNDIMILDLATFKPVDRIALSKPPYPGASPFRLAVTDDPYDNPRTVTSVFISVDSIVRKGTLGLASLDLETRKVSYKPIGPALPMLGFVVSPDRKLGYSVMFSSALGNRQTEWWVWDLTTHKVIKRREFESRPTFRFSLSSDGKKLLVYGSGSTIEAFDASTLESLKFVDYKRDITTNVITVARHGA